MQSDPVEYGGREDADMRGTAIIEIGSMDNGPSCTSEQCTSSDIRCKHLGDSLYTPNPKIQPLRGLSLLNDRSARLSADR